MTNRRISLKSLALGSCAVSALIAGPAAAEQFAVEAQDLRPALQQFASQGDQQVLFSNEAVAGKRSAGFSGEASPEAALQKLLAGTGLTYRRNGDTFLVVSASDPQSGSAAGDGADAGTVQALVVTAQKREENIQDVPIAMSAFTQEDLTRSQVAGGPDLMTQVPNFTFTKTNFSGYSIQIRGIGTQAISATTDAAVAVAFNNTPFIRNRFFEQEFYDLQRVEVLRGPQGTLYGRNATAGVVNIISAKPKFGYEAKLSADVANYNSTRLEGMINLPLVDDKVALRLAGAWTKRDGYDTNQITGNQIDGRDLWSTRLSLRVAPTDRLEANLIWEHFNEDDDRLRSGKQLCHRDDREKVGGLIVDWWGGYSNLYSQGCIPASLYSPEAFEAPNGLSLPYFRPLSPFYVPLQRDIDPYASVVQSRDLRVIESTVDPRYRAQNDLVELQWNADIGPGLSLTSETSYLYDTIFSMEDYNRFNTTRGAFLNSQWDQVLGVIPNRMDIVQPGPYGGVFCDPQIGCADRVVAIDVSRAKSRQFSQEFRLSSNYDGRFNFSLGANFLRYDTEEKYYVFINTLTMFAAQGGTSIFTPPLPPWQPGISDNRECFGNGIVAPDPTTYQYLDGCMYLDPNPIESVNDLGHHYFLSKNPYKLISYAAFGEAYYNVLPNLKVTAGLRWTVDKKEAPRIPSWILAAATAGYPVLAVQEQTWREPTGRLTVDWKPDLSFTDETLLYASYAHGYKAGGSNPPPTGVTVWGFLGNANPEGQAHVEGSAAKPKTFDPEFVNAFEIGSKNTLLDGRLTLNASAFYYDYTGYQVSQIVDRSAVNYNFDARVWGLEVEADWRPLENVRLGLKTGYENTRIANGERAIDMMDRTAGRSDWLVIRPFPTFPSNCVVPTYVFDRGDGVTGLGFNGGGMGPCEIAYAYGLDPVTQAPYVPNPALGDAGWVNYLNYPGYNPNADVGQNHGEGFYKDLSGNQLPNAPHFTATITGDYTLPLPSNWLMTLHTDLYYKSEAWTRVFNMPGYDKLKAYTNTNLAVILSNEESGWKIMAYVKNVFDKDNVTGAFLNSDDTGLTTNVFLNEPRLYGMKVTKEWAGGGWVGAANGPHIGPSPLTIELGGSVLRQDAPYASVAPDFVSAFSDKLDPTAPQHRKLDWGDGRELVLTYRPAAGPWSLKAGYRWGRSSSAAPLIHKEEEAGPPRCGWLPDGIAGGFCTKYPENVVARGINWSDSSAQEREEHAMTDFAVGREFGLGGEERSLWGLGLGLRYAHFRSTTTTSMRGIPDWDIPDGWFKYPTATRHLYSALLSEDREFTGAGPAISWEADHKVAGSEEVGRASVEWSFVSGALFGKQKTETNGTSEAGYLRDKYGPIRARGWLPPLTPVPLDTQPRTTAATVPFVDLSLGLSYDLQRIKVSTGYRWERYFNAIDGGYQEHKSYDRTIDGPYFKIAVGFGG